MTQDKEKLLEAAQAAYGEAVRDISIVADAREAALENEIRQLQLDNAKLREALEQPTPSQSEPVGWTCDDIDDSNCNSDTLEQFCRDNIRLAPFFAMLANKLAEKPTSQDILDAERWRHFACNQTAMMLGSELEPMDTNVNWLEECNRLADAAMKKSER